MRVAYVLPEPVLSGGNKVALQHAALLERRDHAVAVLAAGPRPEWSEFGGEWHDYGPGRPQLDPFELVVATFWPTVELALEMQIGPVAHFCQGYEGSLEHNAPVLDRIEIAYSHDLPTLVVAPHLAELVAERFGRRTRLAPPVIDRHFRPSSKERPSRPPWLVVPGIFEAAVKQIPVALRAVLELRKRRLDARVLRVSLHPLSEQERSVLAPDRYLENEAPEVVAECLRSADLLLFPSRADEGFGLPVLEAMISGVPTVASRIPSTEFMAPNGVALVEAGDAQAMADACESLLGDESLWRESRESARQEALRFGEEVIGPRLELALSWAAGN